MKNNVLIGLNAGLEFTTEENKVIIGDNIVSMDKSQPNCIFLGDNVVIGKTVLGAPCNLYDILREYALNHNQSITGFVGNAAPGIGGGINSAIGHQALNQFPEPVVMGEERLATDTDSYKDHMAIGPNPLPQSIEEILSKHKKSDLS